MPLSRALTSIMVQDMENPLTICQSKAMLVKAKKMRESLQSKFLIISHANFSQLDLNFSPSPPGN
jgi:hypothetical protein